MTLMKNKNLIHRLSFLLLTGLLFTACEDYLDINTNPNNPTRVPPELLLAHASYKTGDNIQLAGNITSYYVQYLASPNAFGSKDIHDPQPYDVTWEEIYRMMSDLTDLETVALEEEASHYVGAAKILKAINLGLAVNLWGDIPYSEAFKGEENLQPSYDDDKTLYAELLVL